MGTNQSSTISRRPGNISSSREVYSPINFELVFEFAIYKGLGDIYNVVAYNVHAFVPSSEGIETNPRGMVVYECESE